MRRDGDIAPIAAYDIGVGYRLDTVATNDAISYEMPDNASEVGSWRHTGAYDDVVNVGLGDFRFPLGTNLCSSLWAHTWGTARPQLRISHSSFSIFNSNELVAVGTPMSALPGVSRFWTASTTNDTFLLTWQDFARGRVPTSTNTSYLLPLTSYLFSVQIELKRSGDFITRSNNVESVYRRINPDDVVLLLGKPYEVKCAQPIVCVETSHADVEVMERYEGCLEICRPVVSEFQTVGYSRVARSDSDLRSGNAPQKLVSLLGDD